VMPEPVREPPDETCQADLRARLDEELSRLPEKYRTAVVLCGLQGRTLRYVADGRGAETTGRPEAIAGVRLRPHAADGRGGPRTPEGITEMRNGSIGEDGPRATTDWTVVSRTVPDPGKYGTAAGARNSTRRNIWEPPPWRGTEPDEVNQGFPVLGPSRPSRGHLVQIRIGEQLPDPVGRRRFWSP
jgi:hypothetical protein